MSENDKALIEKAWDTHPIDYYLINDLIPLAESDEARRKLEDISSRKRHEDEYSVGLL